MYVSIIIPKEEFPKDAKLGDTFDVTAKLRVQEASDTVQIIAINGKSIVPEGLPEPSKPAAAGKGDDKRE